MASDVSSPPHSRQDDGDKTDNGEKRNERPLQNPCSECNKTDIDQKRNERQLHNPYHDGDNAHESEQRKEQARYHATSFTQYCTRRAAPDKEPEKGCPVIVGNGR